MIAYNQIRPQALHPILLAKTIMYCKMLFEIVFFILFVHSSKSDDYKVTDQIYLDVDTDGEFVGRIVIGLFGEVVPKTAANFKIIATNGINDTTYEGSLFHRVIERFMIQGGDILNNNGSGSISIYGKFFNDENFKIKHNGPGIVSMANGGANTNGCQFLITTMGSPSLDGSHVAFGKVIKGQDIVHTIEHMKTDSDYRPLKNIKIIRSGLIPTKTPFYETDDPYQLTLWAWIKAGWFPLSFSFAILGFFHWIMLKLNSFKSFQ